MSAPNPFRCTFLWKSWARECDRFNQPYRGLTGDPLSGRSEAFFLELAPDLLLQERGRAEPAPPIALKELVARGEKRIVLYDQVGAGKRTAARKAFRTLLTEALRPWPDLLPCWLPPIGQRPFTQDVEALLWWEAFNAPPPTSGGWKKLLQSWLIAGPPLVLFLELDRFSDTGGFVNTLGSFLHSSAGQATYCVVTNHSNLGGSERRWIDKGFRTYGVERVDRQKEEVYLLRLRDAGVAITQPQGEPIFRRRHPDRGLLPQLLHLFSTRPQLGSASTYAQIFKMIEAHTLELEREEIERRGLSPENLVTALGRIALTPLTARDDVTSGELEGDPLMVDRRVVSTMLGQEQEIGPSFFFLVEEGNWFRFVDEAFLAYFAAVRGIRDYCGIPVPGSEGAAAEPVDAAWCDRVIDCFIRRPQRSPLVPEFLAGDLNWDQLSQLLLAALARDPKEGEGSRLARTIQALCQGADPNYKVCEALLVGGGDREWWSLEDPDLLRGELHMLLVNKAWSSNGQLAEELARFADRLKGHMAAKGRPWLERCWPKMTDGVPTVEHEDRVTALLVSPPWIVSGDRTGTLVIWDWKHGPPQRVQQHQGRVIAIVGFRHNGQQWVASAGDDGAVRLLALTSDKRPAPERRTQPRAHGGKVFALAVLERGGRQHILSAGEEGLLYDWLPWEPGEPVRTCLGHRGSIRLLEVLPPPSSYCAASAGDDGRVGLWELGPKGELTLCPPWFQADEQPAPVTTLLAESHRVYWGDRLGRVFFAPITPGARPETLRRHTQAVTALLRSGDKILSAGEDGRVFDPDWSPAKRRVREGTAVRCLTRVGHTPVCATGDGAVWLLGPLGPRPEPCAQHPCAVHFLKAFPDEDATGFVTAGERLVRVAGIDQTVSGHPWHKGRVTSLAVGNGFFVSGAQDGSVMLFERVAGAAEWQRRCHWPTHHDGPVGFLKVCDPFLITAGRDGKVCVWRRGLDGPELLDIWRGAPVSALWASGDAIVWAAKDGYVLCSAPGNLRAIQARWPVKEVTKLDVCRPGNQGPLKVIVATSRGEVFRLPPSAGQGPKSIRTGGRGPVVALRCLGADRVAVATADRVETYSIEGPASSTLFGPDLKDLSVLACSADGRWLAWGTRSGKVNVGGGRAQNIHPRGVIALQIAAEEPDILLSAGHDGTIKFSRLGEDRPRILGGCPVGGQISVMEVSGRQVFAGLVDGSVVALQLHLPGPAGGD